MIKISRKKQEKLFWSVCLYLLFLKTVKFLNSIASHNKQKQVTSKHDWTHVKYLNVLYHNGTQKKLQYFFLNILRKYSQLLISDTLGMSGDFHQKYYCQVVETLIFICIQKMNSIPNFFLEILSSYFKLGISSTLGMLDYPHQYWQYHLVGKLDGGGLWKVDNSVTLIFTVAECYFKTITNFPTTKIDCESIVSTLMKNRIIHNNKFKIRSKSIDAFIKKEIALNLMENLLALYIRVRTYSFAKGQILSHRIKQSRLKSRSLWTSLKKMDFENWRVSLVMEWAIFMATNNRKTKIAALFALVLINIRRKKTRKIALNSLFLFTISQNRKVPKLHS